MAQSVELLTSAQVMISWFVGSSAVSGSVLTVWSLLGILSFSLPLPYLQFLCLSLKNIKKKKLLLGRLGGSVS